MSLQHKSKWLLWAVVPPLNILSVNLAWKRTPGLPAPGWEVLASNSYQVMLLILRHTEWGKCFPMSHFISAHESEESEALPDFGCAITGRSLDFSVSPENWNKDTT